MGLYFRKSKSIGPFRFNFSKSGVGVSAGVKGARISRGPKGTTVYAGRDGIYYRKTISKKNKASKNKRTTANLSSSHQNTNSVANNRLSTISDRNDDRTRSQERYCTNTYRKSYAFYPGTESMVSNEIEKRFISSYHMLKPVRTALLIVAFIGVALLAFSNVTLAVPFGLIVVFIVLRRVLKIDLEYSLSEDEELEWNNLLVELCNIKESKKTGLIMGDNSLYSESDMQQFKDIGVLSAGKANGSRIRCNVDTFQIICDDVSIYLLPSCIYLISGKILRLYSYESVDIETSSIRVFDQGYDYASDAINISRSWLYEKKDGSPDLRYKDNPMSTIATYGIISLSTLNDLEIAIAISKNGTAESIRNAFKNYRDNNSRTNEEQVHQEQDHEMYHDDETIVTADVIVEYEVKETMNQYADNPLIRDLKQNLIFDDGDDQDE